MDLILKFTNYVVKLKDDGENIDGCGCKQPYDKVSNIEGIHKMTKLEVTKQLVILKHN